MPEDENDGFYWEPEPDSPLRQGDLLFNVPTTLLHGEPTFVVRPPGARRGELHSYEGFPESSETTEIIAEARWHALTMIVTPTCHISEGEKDEDVCAIVPVDPLGVLVDEGQKKQVRAGKKGFLHFFYLPPTDLGGDSLTYEAVARLDRPTSLLKGNLQQYRRLGLFRDKRYQLRGRLALFWARVSAEEDLRQELKTKIGKNIPLEKIE